MRARYAIRRAESVHPFKPGDRVELVRHYSFFDASPPQGTVISTTNRRIRCKMDRTGKAIRFPPTDLRRLEPSEEQEEAPGARQGSTFGCG